jgi:hypothetical protein
MSCPEDAAPEGCGSLGRCRSTQPPYRGVPTPIADKILREKVDAARSLGHAVCGYYVGNPTGHARWQVCTLLPKHADAHC